MDQFLVFSQNLYPVEDVVYFKQYMAQRCDYTYDSEGNMKQHYANLIVNNPRVFADLFYPKFCLCVEGHQIFVDFAKFLVSPPCFIQVVPKEIVSNFLLEQIVDEKCPLLEAIDHAKDDLLFRVEVMRQCSLSACASSKKCARCRDDMILGINCTKTQFRMNMGRCSKCTVVCESYPKIENVYNVTIIDKMLPFSVSFVDASSVNDRRADSRAKKIFDMSKIFLEEVDRAETVLNHYEFAAIDFEVYEGRSDVVLEFGITYFDPCCKNLRVEHFINSSNLEYSNSKLCMDARFDFAYGSSKLVSWPDFIGLINEYSKRFYYFVAIDSALEQRVFRSLGIPIEGRIIDVQLLNGFSDSRPSSTSLIKQYCLSVPSLHNAGNDSVVAYSSFVKTCESVNITETDRAFAHISYSEHSFSPSNVLDSNFENFRCPSCETEWVVYFANLRLYLNHDVYHRFVSLFRATVNYASYKAYKERYKVSFAIKKIPFVGIGVTYPKV